MRFGGVRGYAHKRDSDVHEKGKKYLQILRRYPFFEKNEASTSEAPAVEKNELEKNFEKAFAERQIVDCLHSSYRQKALKLLKKTDAG